jgi:hypothetical protein
MGTLSHPIISLTTAYSHPILFPSEKQYVVTNPVSLRVKRTLGSAVVRGDYVHEEMFREGMIEEWEQCVGLVMDGRWGRAREVLKAMNERLDAWVGKGKELGEEFHEMRVDLMKCVEFVLTQILEQKSIPSSTTSGNGTSNGGDDYGELAVPERAIRRGDTIRTMTRNTRYPGKWSLPLNSQSEPGSNLPSDDERLSLSTKSLPTNNNLPNSQSYRRESEKLVEEAITRGEPVTLFDNNSPLSFPPTINTPIKTPSTIICTKNPRGSEVISTRNSPVSRDITPTPSDPFGLRKDSRREPSTPTPSPRKRAALYNTPRWPRTGRPSRSPPPETPTQKGPVIKGRKGFGIDGTGRSSIYDEIAVAGDDGDDPAERIWKGIDEEYMSPEGGRITRSRRLRRRGSIRPSVLDD